MAATNLKRTDTTRGPPLRVLSLDGGGVRGYSMLILLQELMHRTFVEMYGRAPKRHEIPKPCDHFDLIAGTGTGGLIALMLGRLRLDLDTCKDTYVRLTKRVFETDKTFAGIPYRSTLFKASKLEEVIKETVREHTVFDDEGNDSLASATPMSPVTPGSAISPASHRPSRSMSNASASSSAFRPISNRGAMSSRWGNPNALLYDVREHRTKTAVTAIYKGTPQNGMPALLRSYDSRKEPAPEFHCTIWQAGRATSAIGLAFKPIQIGQSIFIDEGAGRYNPAPQILDEAVANEYPGRDMGVFVSIGTGKRPANTQQKQSEWWEGFLGGTMGDFAEARRRLISKIEGCETTHQYMLHEHLSKRGVNPENYYRLNVEVGVGEFGMNEWNRLSDISANTRMYLSKPDVQGMNLSAAGKLARIHKMKEHFDQAAAGSPGRPYSWEGSVIDDTDIPSNPMAVELPAEDVVPQPPTYQTPSHQIPSAPPSSYTQPPTHSHPTSNSVYRPSDEDKFAVLTPERVIQRSGHTPPRTSGEHHNSHISTDVPPHSAQAPPTTSAPPYSPPPNSAPPLPPKTPIGFRDPGQFPDRRRISADQAVPNLPYPDPEGPPPTVNMANKPRYGLQFPPS